ncbi:MurR/RpiR family transcriptional regulator [Paenibacillus sp. DMB5]|uniref:MurR/RpiR family transcriptional regulator n=1 Tax=Paenibacillus sp. DMB5 TaxID=1780103 RepID=UPI00076BE398|nr:MurR/RpiR family transcriptional regulator [Paenibacillus sp. DMB5]KUP25911.1 RpiR family transcriptional regulator [Paenibacillus sp. DMB5]
MGLINSLENKRDFTEVETRLADYILEHAEEISHLSITELAKRTYTSNPTIIRLCRKVGIAGYREFRIEFSAELEKQRYDKSTIDFNYPFAARESTSSIMKSVATITKESIDTCYASLSMQAMGQAARWLCGASHIYIFALGDTYINAIAFSNMLVKLGFHPILVDQYHESMTLSFNATQNDVALLVSYSGCVLDSYKKELKVLKKNSCRTILITSLQETNQVDLLIKFPQKEHEMGKAAGYYSQSSIRYILNCLYSIIYSFDFTKNKERKDIVEEMARKNSKLLH